MFGMNTPESMILTGQKTLILCCLCYLAWWYVAFRPGADNHTLTGKKEVLFALTALTGLSGVFISAVGIHILPESNFCTVKDIFRAAAIGYAVLAVITCGLYRRPLTAELAIIVAWSGFELAAVNALTLGGNLTTETAILCR